MNITYWLGYINNKFNIIENNKNDKYIYILLIILGIVTLRIDYKDMNSYIAIKSIQTGEAYQYDTEIKERIKLYEDKDIKDVEVNSLQLSTVKALNELRIENDKLKQENETLRREVENVCNEDMLDRLNMEGVEL